MATFAAFLALAGCSRGPGEERMVQQRPAPPSHQAEAVPAKTPALRPDPQACAASVAEAQSDGRHPERLSAQIAPAPYVRPRDSAAMQRHLDVIEPGRIYQTADPATGAAQLTAVGGDGTRVIPAMGSVELAVRTAPGAPCTFLATEGGSFAETRLACATVLASEDGVARATYHADAGTVDDATVLVGSPDAVGTLALTVHVHHPDSFMPAPTPAPTASKP